MGQRVDFSQSNDWQLELYYHFDDSTVNAALTAGAASVPGFPATTPTRAEEFR
jgi:hypothetical protein